MVMDGFELGRRVLALGRRGQGARIPVELRAELIRYAGERRRCGEGVGGIARTLGVSAESIRLWTRSDTIRRALVPIVVRAEPPVVAGAVTVVAPGGYRVEGLTIAATAELLRHLA